MVETANGDECRKCHLPYDDCKCLVPDWDVEDTWEAEDGGEA